MWNYQYYHHRAYMLTIISFRIRNIMQNSSQAFRSLWSCHLRCICFHAWFDYRERDLISDYIQNLLSSLMFVNPRNDGKHHSKIAFDHKNGMLIKIPTQRFALLFMYIWNKHATFCNWYDYINSITSSYKLNWFMVWFFVLHDLCCILCIWTNLKKKRKEWFSIRLFFVLGVYCFIPLN